MKITNLRNITKGEFIMGIRRVENMCGGKGHVIIKDILEGDELKGKCGLYAQVTIEKGCSLGYHEHHGESETYYILSGQGEYDDNGRGYHHHTRRKGTCSYKYRRYRSCIYGADHF